MFQRILIVVSIALPTVVSAQDGDAVLGKKIFKKCKICYHVDKPQKKMGPSLQGVIGRTAGTWGPFNYSEAMSQAGADGLVWTVETLDQYLIKPKAMVPGTRMPFGGLKDKQDRANLIAYIRSAAPAAE